MHPLDERPLREPAVGAADDALSADELREAHEALRDELGVLDDVRVVGDDAGDEHLALGQLDVLPEPPLVLVAGVRLLDQVVARVDREHEVDDVLERRVEGVRAVPAPEADVVADPVLRDPRERVVERVDPELRPAAVVLDRPAERQDGVVLVQQHGVVDLEQEARVDDPLVLLVQRVGDRVDELLLGRVVLVAQPVDARRRDDGQEDVGGVHAVDGRLESRDVLLERCRVVGDRPRARPDLSERLAVARRRALPGTSSEAHRFFTSRANSASCSA